MSAFFITATGTEIGKTVLTAALCYQLRQKQKSIFAIKPVISGFDAGDEGNDTFVLAKSLGYPTDPETINRISPFRFEAPLSPNLAAAREGRAVNPEALLDFCDRTIAENDLTLIEGIGGTHVPITKDFLVADWILDLGVPAILVTGSYLGALSHTLVSLEALDAMGVRVKAVVVSQSADEPMPFEETVSALMEEVTGTPIYALPRILSRPLFEHAPDMTKVLD